MPAPVRSAALLAAAALGLAACAPQSSSEDSAEDFQGAQRQVAQVVEDFQEAGADRDANEICQRLLTDELRRSIQQASRASCPSAMDDVLGDVDATELVVEKVEVSGQTARATVRGEAGDEERTDVFTLSRQGDGWRISGLGS